MVLSFTISLRQQLRSSNQNAPSVIKSSNPEPKNGDPKCVLCLDYLKNVSLTQCGHLFCWECIMEWLGQREECPICREPLKQSRIIFLQNYY